MVCVQVLVTEVFVLAPVLIHVKAHAEVHVL